MHVRSWCGGAVEDSAPLMSLSLLLSVRSQNVPLGIELGFADGKRFTPNGGTPMVIGSPGGVPVIGDNGAATFNVTVRDAG